MQVLHPSTLAGHLIMQDGEVSGWRGGGVHKKGTKGRRLEMAKPC